MRRRSSTRDSFYMATVSGSGWPYVQHRGGPPGLVKVLNEKTLDFADFRGNRQYISLGNINADDRVALIAVDYTPDSRWRNRREFPRGRPAIIELLTRKWTSESEYRLIKELWGFHENRIAVRFCYEWHDDNSDWFRSYRSELWEFDGNGLMRARDAGINDVPIREEDRKFRWDRSGSRPADHPGLGDLGL
jgi:uncharacterized protein